jgi:hypothetical protein
MNTAWRALQPNMVNEIKLISWFFKEMKKEKN